MYRFTRLWFPALWADGVNLHVRGLGEGGRFVAHKPTGEGADLIWCPVYLTLSSYEDKIVGSYEDNIA